MPHYVRPRYMRPVLREASPRCEVTLLKAALHEAIGNPLREASLCEAALREEAMLHEAALCEAALCEAMLREPALRAAALR